MKPDAKTDHRAIPASEVFDADWYVARYKDVQSLGMDPLDHYMRIGALIGRDPNPYFSMRDYMARHPELITQGLHPFRHFLESAAPDRPYNLATVEARRKALRQVLPPETHRSPFGQTLINTLTPAVSDNLMTALSDSEAALKTLTNQAQSLPEPPLVSIIMPSFNRADIITDAITSVITQSYTHWELLVCDDGSTDHTRQVVEAFQDPRVTCFQLKKAGAAAARNHGLRQAKGEIIAYLDTDNIWHPHYLSAVVTNLTRHSGHSAAYGNYIDYRLDIDERVYIDSFSRPPFHHEKLLQKNYIDLNTFAHRRELYDAFGGFNPALKRRQDYDLILKYTWLRDPLQINEIVALYQRNPRLEQITQTQGTDQTCVQIINDSLDTYLAKGLPLTSPKAVRSVTILSWDLCRNHFSKAFAVAEALSAEYDVQLIAFKFFEEDIFPPLRDVSPQFETLYLPGAPFPEFFDTMEKAVSAIRGDIIYAIKPRLPSLGLALLAHHQKGIPLILESNDLETVVSAPKNTDIHTQDTFEALDSNHKELLNPYSDLWSRILDPIAAGLPVLVTHNKNLDAHFGHRSLFIRNPKDEAMYDPALYDRQQMRRELVYSDEDRVILFGGMLRKHKGIYELVELAKKLNDPRYKLLFAGSRLSPDQQAFAEAHGSGVRILPPQNRKEMARLNHAADLVILWLDPDVPASHYQMPYKLTDALAMGPTVIANPISSLSDLGAQDYLHLVPFGDWDTMCATIDAVFADERAKQEKRMATRRLFLRQFSYNAVRSGFELAARRALQHSASIAVAGQFSDVYNRLRTRIGVG